MKMQFIASDELVDSTTNKAVDRRDCTVSDELANSTLTGQP